MSSKMAARGVEWSSAEPGILEGWTLSFNQAGWPPAEPSFANVVPLADGGEAKAPQCTDAAPPPSCHGVVYTMTPQHFDTLWESEGSGDWYTTEKVKVRLYSGEVVESIVFCCVPRRRTAHEQSVPPSERYMTFLREGGKAAGLSPEYTEWLSKLPTAPKNPLVAFTFGQFAVVNQNISWMVSTARKSLHPLNPLAMLAKGVGVLWQDGYVKACAWWAQKVGYWPGGWVPVFLSLIPVLPLSLFCRTLSGASRLVFGSRGSAN